MKQLSQFFKAASPFGIKGMVNVTFSRLLLRAYNKLNKHTIRNYEILLDLSKQGVVFQKKGAHLLLVYSINEKEFTFKLKRHSSDLAVFKQIIINQEYRDVILLLKSKKINPSAMIDAGANIGLATIYFKAHYPDLKVLAVEPSYETFKRMMSIFSENDLHEVKEFQGAIWSENTELNLDNSFRDGQDWAIRTVNKTSNRDTVEAIDILKAIDMLEVSQIDILKVDIEGAENEVFSTSESVKGWLPKIKCLVIEIHDEFQCRDRIIRILEDFDFELIESHEYTIGMNKNI